MARASLNIETLEPREELEFIGGWEQIDNRGEPVPPGVYSVRAVLNLDPPEKLVTEAHELEVQMPTTADSPPPPHCNADARADAHAGSGSP